eukprot:TRINITY_DN4144_c0_g2_i1.p1 TRINITY_DN4144_c0_g2~~TRINITY_DN4144_c0_g2_i1.p1  ORF type:complete len:412 (-),score=119.68 TRINITY_DN4144_c0_g2_i1:68-1303(-)
MAPAKSNVIKVCTSIQCSQRGAKDLVKDIEEICLGSTCKVQAGSCVDRCTRGPNVEVNKNGSKTIIEGVNDFAKAYKVISSEGGVKISSTMKQVATLKYEARRTNGSARMVVLKKAFGILGDEATARKKEPLILAGLLLMRVVETMTSHAEAALKDAELAVMLAPNWGSALLHVALALDANGKRAEARDTVDSLTDKYANDDALMQRVFALERKMDEDDEKANGAGKKAEEEARARQQEEDAKREAELQKQQAQIAEEEEKKKNEAEAKKAAQQRAAREKAQKQAEDEARRKQEAEAEAARQQEEEEARRKVEEEEREAKRKRDEVEAAKKLAMAERIRQQEEEMRKAKEAREAEVAEAEERRLHAVKMKAMMQEERRKQAAANAGLFACCSPAKLPDSPRSTSLDEASVR